MALSTKQKWFIGCGGCLGLIGLVIAVIIAGCVILHNMSVDASVRLFGKEPATFATLFGMNVNGRDISILMSRETGRVLVGITAPEDENFKSILHAPDTQDAATLVKVQETLRDAASRGGAASSSASDFKLEGLRTVKSGAKAYKLAYLKTITNKGQVMPTVVAFIPKAPKDVLMAALIDGTVTTTDTMADFKGHYAELDSDIQAILQN